ncbi:MAG TPA: ATP-binding protein [Pyrinomonadaceae bacterium]|jgi:signal transduction histidine kinase/ActR/RegA family two-component response regulator
MADGRGAAARGARAWGLKERFMALTGAAGAAACLFSAWGLRWSQLDLSFAAVAVVTIGVGARAIVKIPRVKGEVTATDTFIFLTALLYDGEAAVLLAVVEALFSSMRITKTWLTVFFNAGLMGCSTFAAVWAVRAIFGHIPSAAGGEFNARSVGLLCTLALTQYATNSALAAVREGLRDSKPVWRTWRESYFWISTTTVAAAAAAMIAARLINATGIYSVILILPIVAVVVFAYKAYLKNVEAAEAQAEQARMYVKELSRYVAEQERIRVQFSQVEKLSAVGSLASGVAHDFNNCLAVIRGRAELMLKYTADPKMRRGLELIVQSARDGARTVKRIQDFARQRQDRDFEPVSVDQLLLDASEITRPRWKDEAEAGGAQINFQVSNRSGAHVLGDASELRDVLVNMIFNAVDAMPAGGRLTLSAEQRDEKVVVTVGDTGCGMSPEVRTRAFDPFFTTKGVEGMGLGLSVSYGVIRRHGGNIRVESEVGRGSTFRVVLPLAGCAGLPSDDALAAGEADAAIRRRLTARILVVDDEEPVRGLLCEILEEEGVEVTLASSGAEALARFEPGKFDAVLTDLGMPGMNGWELLRRVGELDRRVPLAVITGWGELVSTHEEKAARVEWVLTKPFAVSQICEIAEEITRRKHSRDGGDQLTLVA